MEYNAFLVFLNQIANQKKAKVVVQGSVIFIETSSHKGQWNLSTKILGTELKRIQKSLGLPMSKGSLKWQGKGAYLKADPETDSLYLMQEIISSSKYIPFRHVIQDFASVASEWKEILEECSDEENLKFHLV